FFMQKALADTLDILVFAKQDTWLVSTVSKGGMWISHPSSRTAGMHVDDMHILSKLSARVSQWRLWHTGR
ncbi:MAG: hypothetical protein ACKPKO_55210, partial [Candidatus Fonsibacter sp.]